MNIDPNHTLFASQYAHRMSTMPRSCVRDLMSSFATPDCISFAGGAPAAECLPISELQRAADRVWTRYGRHAMAYGPSEGEPLLREWIAHSWLARYGIQASPDEILITHGSQQALDLLGKVLLDPGSPVAVERPTYLAALQAFSAYEATFREVPLTDEGPDVSALARALRGNSSTQFDGARLFYTIPNFQNPSAQVTSERRRMELADELNRHAALLVEDDPYGELYYSNPPPRYLGCCGVEQRVLLGSFSKIIAPGLRLGFIWCQGSLRHHLITVKQAADLCGSRFNEWLLWETLQELDLEQHLNHLRNHYRHRRDAMEIALQTHLQGLAQWEVPQGGMFFWVRLKVPILGRALLNRCLPLGVAFANGGSFCASGGGDQWIRLNFTGCTVEQMHTGLQRLRQAMDA